MDDFDTEAPAGKRHSMAAKKRGRPRKTVTKTTERQEFLSDPAESEADDTGLTGSPILDQGDESASEISRIRVTRVDPPEGMVGYLDDVEATEQEIIDKWGGGIFNIQGVTAMGRIAVAKKVRLAGDPKFVSQTAELQWRKARGLPLAGSPSPSTSAEMTFSQMLTYNEQKAEKERAAEDARREREATATREHAKELERIRADAEDRRRRDDEDRDRRRREDDAERDRRRTADQNAAEERSRQFMAQMLTMVQESGKQALDFVKASAAPPGTASGPGGIMDAVKLVLAIKEGFADGGGGGSEEPTDPLGIIMKHGPEWLNGLGNAVGGAIREIKTPGGGGAPPQALQLPPVQQQAAPASQGLVLPPELAPKVGLLAASIAQRGEDPAEVIGKILDNLNSQIAGQPSPHVEVMKQTAAKQSTGPIAPSPTVNPQTVNTGPDVHGVVRMGFGAS